MVGCSTFVAAPAHATNVLLILADDLGRDKTNGWADYGTDTPGFLPSTPTIDELRAAGLTFTSAWGNPVCSPTRAGINTGKHAYVTGVGWGISEESGADGELDNSAYETLAERFVTGGFATGLFGKWHVGVTGSGGRVDWNLDSGDPDPTLVVEDPHAVVAGFQTYIGDPNGAVESYVDWDRVDGDGSGVSTIRSETTDPDDVAVDEALNWIGDQSGSWFAVVAFNAPHTKHAATGYEIDDVDPSCFVDACIATDSCGDYDGDGSASRDQEMLIYQSMVECLDARIETLLSGIAPGTLNQTIVVFAGDNGTPPGVLEKGYNDDSTHDQGKNSIYESGIAVPLVILDGQHWRDLIRGRAFSSGSIRSPGRKVTSPVHLMDIFDTALQAAGLAVPAGTDAESLWNCATVKSATCATPSGGRGVYTEGYEYNSRGRLSRGEAAVRTGRYKLVINYDAANTCLATEMYDLTTDIYELSDVNDSKPSARDSLRDRVTAMAVPWMAGLPWC